MTERNAMIYKNRWTQTYVDAFRVSHFNKSAPDWFESAVRFGSIKPILEKVLGEYSKVVGFEIYFHGVVDDIAKHGDYMYQDETGRIHALPCWAFKLFFGT